MNNNLEKIDRDLFAAIFDDTPEEPKKIASLSEDGCFVIDKSSDGTTFRESIDFVKAIMRLDISDLNTEHGFCEWMRGSFPRIDKYPDETILKLKTGDPYKKFHIVYQKLSAAETQRRTLRKQWILSHPLEFLRGFLNEGK